MGNKYYLDSISHYGVLGQKWGIRRYQNPDGTLTAEGRKRLGKDFKKKSNNDSFAAYRRSKDLDQAGVVSGKDYDVIKAGSTIGRQTSANEKIDSNRKYVYLTDSDKNNYQNFAKAGWFGDASKMHEVKMTAVKDLKVAKFNDVVDTLVSKYGDTSVKDAWDTAKNYDLLNNMSKKYELASSKNEKEQFSGDYAIATTNELKTFFNNTFMHNPKISDEVFKEYEKKGYDAIEDIEDRIGGFEYPIILLNPKNSVKYS